MVQLACANNLFNDKLRTSLWFTKFFKKLEKPVGHDPRAIANYFVKLGIEHNNPLTVMQLLKLAYIGHGCNVALYGTPLSDESPEAWKYGPVFPTLYQGFKFYGTTPVNKPAQSFSAESFDFQEITSSFSEQEKNLMKAVYQKYSQFSGPVLSEWTHQAGTPWYKIWVEDGAGKNNVRNAVIPDNLIAQYFQDHVLKTPEKRA